MRARHRLLIALFLLLGCATAAGLLGQDPPPAPGVRYVGRFDAADPRAVRLSWSGSGFVTRFFGTGARATLRGGEYFTVVVDGVARPEPLAVSERDATYELASGLPEGEHTIEVYRRTEGALGVTVVGGVRVQGELLSVPRPARQIEVVGDSFSAGYGVEGADASCRFSPETENHFLTWAAITARAVNAELSNVSWSGKGVIYNYDEDRTAPMSTLYDRVIATEPARTGTIRPADVVFVNLGGNDYSTDGDPPDRVFVPAYVSLLEQIRRQHPDARIFCTVGPPLPPADMARARGATDQALAARVAAGDDRVRWFDMKGGSDFGCDYHPGKESQARMAEDAIALLRAELGW